jgi:hypothetical protein
MNQAQILRQKFEEDLKNLQDNCTHSETKWMPYMYAPARYSGKKALVCKECDKIVKFEEEPTFPFQIMTGT